VPWVDLIDETFIVAAPSELAVVVHDPQRWRAWWPDLQLTVFMDRGEQGVRWSVTGDLVGSAEIWLEPFGDGVVVHHYLRADPTRPGSRTEVVEGDPAKLARLADRVRRRHALAWKRSVNALKDELEAGRAPGMPREGVKPPPEVAEGLAREGD
jgi:hypothetical protein